MARAQKVLYFRRMIRASAAHAAVLVCVSEYTAERLRALVAPSAEVVVAHHGVDHERFAASGDAAADLDALAAHGIAPPFVAFVGTIEPRKNVPTLVQAFARVGVRPARRSGSCSPAPTAGACDAVRDAISASGVATRIVRPGLPRRRHGRRAVPPGRGRRVSVVRGGLRSARARSARVRRAGRDHRRIRARRGRRATRHCSTPPDDPGALADAIASVLDDPAVAAPAARRRTARSRRVHVGALRRAARRRLPSGPRPRSAHVKALDHRRHRIRRSVPRRPLPGAGRRRRLGRPLGPGFARHHRPRGGARRCSRSAGPRSSTTSPRSRTSASRGAIRPRCSASTSTAPRNVLDAARAAGVRRVVVVGSAEEYGQRRRARSAPAGGRAAAAHDAVRREQGRGVVPGAAGVPRARSRRRPRPRRSPTPARARSTGSSCRRSRPASPRPSATEQDEIRVGSLDPVRDLSDVRDVVRAYRLLAEHGEAGEVYNVCAGTGVSVARDRRTPARRRPPAAAPDRRSGARTAGRGAPARRRRVASPRGDRLVARDRLDETLAAVLDGARDRAAG